MPYATKAFAEDSFGDVFRLNPSIGDLARLAALCSSQFRPFLKSVRFEDYYEFQWTKNNENLCPDYSGIQNIGFRTYLNNEVSIHVLKKLLQQTTRLQVFKFCPRMVRKGDPWYEQYRRFKPATRTSGGKDEQREKVNVILSSIRSDCLSELDLADAVLSYKPLVSLLERHGGTIRKLSLHDCRLIGGSWIDLLQWVSSELPSLEYLCLAFLQELKWRRAFNKYDYSDMMWETLVEITGKNNIDTYIASLDNGETAN